MSSFKAFWAQHTLGAIVMVDLSGVAALWWADVDVKHRMRERDVEGLLCSANTIPLSCRDKEHALLNKCVIGPIMCKMKEQSSLAIPGKAALETQVKLLACFAMGKETMTPEDLGKFQFEDQVQVHIYVVVTGLKQILSFVRKIFIRGHVPRDSWRPKTNGSRLPCPFHSLTQAPAGPPREGIAGPLRAQGKPAFFQLRSCV